MDPTDPSTWPASARALFEQRTAAAPQAPLRPLLVERIRRAGPITFAELMEAALYHPTHGYYLREAPVIAPAGDFVTAPAHHPAFGRLVGRRVRQITEGLGSPRELVVVEMGAGDGALAEGILAELRESDRPLVPVQYRIVEPFVVWRQRQAARLERFAGTVEWVDDLDGCAPFTGAFVSNELLDAFPVHRVVHHAGRLRELWVTVVDGRLVFEEDAPSTPALEEYFNAAGVSPPNGVVVEVNLRLRPWARAVARRLEGGSFLTLDYGTTAGELYGAGRGTLRAYREHSAAPDPLALPGLQDLTADVDFSTLIRGCEEEGLELEAFTTQRDFLLAMGWKDWLTSATPGGRRRLAALIDPLLMGRTRVLEMVRR